MKKNWRPDSWSKCPCDECDRKLIDDYGYFCDLACGERTAWLNRETGADAMHKVDVAFLNRHHPALSYRSDGVGFITIDIQKEDWESFIEEAKE